MLKFHYPRAFLRGKEGERERERERERKKEKNPALCATAACESRSITRLGIEAFRKHVPQRKKTFRHPQDNHTKMATASSPRVDGSSSNSDGSGSTNDGNAISAAVSAVRTLHSRFRASLAAKPINKVRGHFLSLSLLQPN